MSGCTKTSRIGTSAEPDRRQRRRAAVDRASGAVGEEPGEREHEQHLPELGRLEREEADVDPALRAARGGAGREHEHHHRERPEVDRPAQSGGRRSGSTKSATTKHDGARRRRTAPGGRERGAARVVARDPVDRPEAVGRQPQRRAGEQQPVEPADEPRAADSARLRGAAGARARGCRRLRSPSVGLASRGRGRLLAEVLLEDLQRRRRRRRAAVAAVLDHGADDDRRRCRTARSRTTTTGSA